MSRARELAEIATAYDSGSPFGFRNRIINGQMVIDQRNAGASVTANDNIFGADRWKYTMVASSKGTTQQSTTAPAGFSTSLLFTSSAATSVGSSDYYWVDTRIEGNNLSDMGFGTAAASSFTMSFWVRSSLTGTFGGSFENSASNRSYPFSYTISAANTWEQKTVTVAGDTSGTWLTNNGVGLRVIFSLGVGSTRQGTANAWASADYQSPSGCVNVVGTSGATFYITGVQLEKGSTATSFDYRLYGTELVLCERYYQKITGVTCGTGTSGSDCGASVMFKTEMRAGPSVGLTAPFSITRFNIADFTQSSASVAIGSGGTRVTATGVSLNFSNFTSLPSDTALPSIVTGGAITLSSEL